MVEPACKSLMRGSDVRGSYRFRLLAGTLGSIVLSSVLVSFQRASSQQTINLKFHEGTEMEAVPSPNGRLIALQLWRHIWVLDANGGEARRLTDATRPPAEHQGPAWSPDSRTILFSMMFADPDKRGNPHLVPVTGGEPEPVAAPFVGAVAWSPDGTRLLCLRDDRLWSVSITDSAATRLNPDSLPAKDPAWSPDGRWVVFASGGRWWSGRSLYLVSAAGDSLRELTRGSDYVPSWSPDGRRLFFVSERSGIPQIWSVFVEGGEPRQLTDEPEVYPFPPRWWPGRDVLLYTAAGKIRTLDPESGARDSVPFTAKLTIPRETYHPRRPAIPGLGDEVPVKGIYRPAALPDGGSVVFAAMGDLWLRQADGRVDQLTTGPDYEGDAAWSPDGTRLAFISERGGEYNLWVLDLRDRSRRQLTTSGGAQTPVWHPSGDSIVFRHSWNVIRIVPASGGEARMFVETRGFGIQPLGWLRNGGDLVYWHAFPLGWRSTTAVRSRGPTGDSATLLVSDPRAKISFATLSPSGDSLAYVTNGELWVRPLLTTGGSAAEPRRLVEGPVFFPSWSRDGRIVYMSGERLMRVDVHTGERRRLPVSLSYRVPSAPSLLLRNATILAPEPREGRWDLLLERGRIQRIRPSGTGGLRADSTVDLGGLTVIPGLFDVHTHAGWFGVAPSSRAAYLYRGITSIGDAGSEGYWVTELREAVESGLDDGPRIFVAGPQVTGTAPNQPPTQVQASTPTQVERYVDHLVALGASHVKTYNQWEPWVEAAAIRGAHRRGLRTLSHFLRPSSVAAGLDRKEHVDLYQRGWLTRYRQDVLDILTGAAITLVPTSGPEVPGCTARRIALSRSVLVDTALAGFMSAARRESALRNLERCQVSTQATYAEEAFLYSIGAAYRAGVRIAAGSDSDLLTQEILELLVSAGLTPLDALRAATVNAAAALGVEDRLGSIREGAIADLVIVEGDPLMDISDTKRVWGVVKDGRWVERAALLARARVTFAGQR